VLARPEGFEPPTPRFVVWSSYFQWAAHSNHRVKCRARGRLYSLPPFPSSPVKSRLKCLERAKGIEPSYAAWEAELFLDASMA
jgi:hypothetical protein